MKNSKKLSYHERKIVHSWGLDPTEWRRIKLVNETLILQNSQTGEIKEVPARIREC